MNTLNLKANARPTPYGYSDVEPRDLARERGNLRVVDVREVSEFNDMLGHVPGAQLVPLATLAQAAGGWRRDEPVAVVCRSSGRSGRGAALLAQLGFGQVYNMAGGMLAWNSLGLPVERGEQPVAQ